VIGVGQVAERIEDPGYAGLSPIDLAVGAARAAVADSQADGVALIAAVDTIAATRQFENSSPRAVAPLGKSTKFPLSVAHRLGAAPRRAVLDVVGGQSPQQLVSGFSRAIEAGLSDVVLLVGAEAISTIRHYARAEHKPDFSDDPAGQIEDRGFGLTGLVTPALAAHGMGAPSTQYALLENARRAAQGRGREEYAAAMGELLAPFTKVAAKNPFSAAPVQRSADELVTVTERNRMIADPYPRFVVARDQVNQAAAVLLASVGAAQRLGVARDKWVFLHGQANLVERSLLERAVLGEAPSAVAAVRHALQVAHLGVDDIDFFDFYSCFPIAVFNIIDAIGLSASDPRGLTLTGGLPFFGGPATTIRCMPSRRQWPGCEAASAVSRWFPPTAGCCRKPLSACTAARPHRGAPITVSSCSVSSTSVMRRRWLRVRPAGPPSRPTPSLTATAGPRG